MTNYTAINVLKVAAGASSEIAVVVAVTAFAEAFEGAAGGEAAFHVVALHAGLGARVLSLADLHGNDAVFLFVHRWKIIDFFIKALNKPVKYSLSIYCKHDNAYFRLWFQTAKIRKKN